MFSASVLIKRQGRLRQWGHYLSVMETIGKLVATPRFQRHDQGDLYDPGGV